MDIISYEPEFLEQFRPKNMQLLPLPKEFEECRIDEYKFINAEDNNILKRRWRQKQVTDDNMPWRFNNERQTWLSKQQSKTTTESIYIQNINQILNHITADSFNSMIEELKKCIIISEKHLNILTNIFIDNTANDCQYTHIYVQLCRALHIHIQSVKEKEKDKATTETFGKKLLNMSHTLFTHVIDGNYSSDDSSINFILNKLKNDNQTNFMVFLGDLYNYGLFTESIMLVCVNTLFDKFNSDVELNVIILQCLCKFVSSICIKLKSNNIESMSTIRQRLHRALKEKIRTKKFQFLIMDVLDIIDK
jgi:hypothetical protein